MPALVWLVLMLACAIGGFIARGIIAPPRSAALRLASVTSVSESQLDDVMATYVLDDETYEVTVRDAIEQTSSVDAMRLADGSYQMPPVEGAISAARMAIMSAEAERQGISVSNEELDSYVAQTFGTTDYATIALNYGMDEAVVRERLRESATMAALREKVAPAASNDELAEPVAPEDGDTATANGEYAAYIFALAGAEWDADANAWASADGPYATALRDYDVRNDSASYEAAQTAYYLAVQQREQQGSAAQDEWTAYVNDLLSQASMTLCSLVS